MTRRPRTSTACSAAASTTPAGTSVSSAARRLCRRSGSPPPTQMPSSANVSGRGLGEGGLSFNWFGVEAGLSCKFVDLIFVCRIGANILHDIGRKQVLQVSFIASSLGSILVVCYAKVLQRSRYESRSSPSVIIDTGKYAVELVAGLEVRKVGII